MIIEDITHEDYLEMAKNMNLHMTVGDIKSTAKQIAKKYSLPVMDSRACLFIALEIKKDISVLGFERYKARRINEVFKLRNGEAGVNILRDCPFCGNKVKVEKVKSMFNNRQSMYQVSCGCEVAPTTAMYKLKEDAIKVWNRKGDKRE